MFLCDFSRLDSAQAWYSINDGVMGGLSRSRMSASPLGHAVFSGHVSLANGGGFASVRKDELSLDLSGAERLQLWVKGDGKRYKLNLKDSIEPLSPVFQYEFDTDDSLSEEWQKVVLPVADYQAKSRGQILDGIAPDFNAIVSLGLVIGDKQGGDFTLLIKSIEAL
ncbi:CIA30 family protein [Shewanella corallii]|uniref:CIA30 family protein n=1 Tax=Shewanella corallii TaxID=560080 RepID=A0ABT0NAC3_9GAMM|nr:CIA30 family protein [Shewanella corallii]MCL2915330.1 CIA30 family protein [Shewanella corallii]